MLKREVITDTYQLDTKRAIYFTLPWYRKLFAILGI